MLAESDGTGRRQTACPVSGLWLLAPCMPSCCNRGLRQPICARLSPPYYNFRAQARGCRDFVESLLFASAEGEFPVFDLQHHTMPAFLDDEAAGCGQVRKVGRDLANYVA